ncbi:hypothetical protein [Streptomyces sp. NPDC096153]|uniref:hypothetical protein n=1 Tax=Streptomyces sp. NPDC096153 TaxID=3155548 RepID=UPI00332A3E5A
MIIVYAPQFGEPEHFDARTLRVSESSIAQRTIDRPWDDIEQGVRDEDLECLRVVAWLIKKRAQPTLRFGDFDPLIGELYMRLDNTEVANWIEGAQAIIGAAPDATAEQVRSRLAWIIGAALDPEYAERKLEEALADPKDEPDPPRSDSSGETPTSTSGEPDTSSSSDTSSPSRPTTSTP